MGNALGGMVFIVAGITLGYWVVTGRAQKFLSSLGSANAPAGATVPQASPPSSTSPQNPAANTGGVLIAASPNPYAAGSGTSQSTYDIPWSLPS